MLGFLARSVIAITVGTVFLIAVLFAFVSDALHGDRTQSRQLQTHPPRNRDRIVRSETIAAQETQS